MTLLELTFRFDDPLKFNDIMTTAKQLGIDVPSNYGFIDHAEMVRNELKVRKQTIAVGGRETNPVPCGSCGGGEIR